MTTRGFVNGLNRQKDEKRRREERKAKEGRKVRYGGTRREEKEEKAMVIGEENI